MDENNAVDTDSSESLGTYSEMFGEYLADPKNKRWIGPAEMPLVFHLRKLCARLDADPDAPAALSSAYLQAFSRLDKRNPDYKPVPGAAPGQGTIFDELD